MNNEIQDTLPLVNVKPNVIVMVFKRLLEPALIVSYLWVLVRLNGLSFSGDYWVLAIMAFFISSYFFSEFHERRLRRNPKGVHSVAPIFIDWLAVVAVLGLIGYICEFYQQFSPQVITAWVLGTPIGLMVSQYAQGRVMRDLHTKGEVSKAIIIGVNPAALKMAERMENYPALMIKLMGFFDDREINRQPQGTFTPLMGKMSDVAAYVRKHNINMVYISMPISAQPRVLQMIDELQDTTASIYFVPDIYIFNLIQARFDYVGGMAVMAICETPFTGMNNFIKRVSDIILASIILLMLLPVLMVVSICVKATSPGPIIFKQRRYGLDGEEIVVYKFRSMTVMEDGAAVKQAQKGDMRLTKIGGFLRKSSLDELPQFVNVLQGRMSIVGPRPHAVAHNELYRKQIKGYMLRHKVKPGITGWAQVNGLRGETETLDKMKARIEFDLEYLRRWSLTFDLWIIVQTVRLVLKRENAY
ncbi:undecaprenyl-phosphate glucose phosphotransferase [Herbaspirillum sp. LeCh32-8]|uniref:undecaprenyl-phosphate glucose phosphotransferase n=1 Tax=Herbaspirillum sp. LeCh32-8 TaxID=2821356 RepID=UPI001AE164FF|nr:undecaprenyl-phosphate glucose phosphotransferase [Herbaspirillum sp. LeCh32-8]MBP0596903.1 undecaprenyl-phosphate glucose phosphotransferase [Herbaspirillum sp. LeCh32-8]